VWPTHAQNGTSTHDTLSATRRSIGVMYHSNARARTQGPHTPGQRACFRAADSSACLSRRRFRRFVKISSWSFASCTTRNQPHVKRALMTELQCRDGDVTQTPHARGMYKTTWREDMAAR